ncbi:Nucleotide-binding alpha-beta plait domain [Phytophthora cactorum]|nr:Nucleotide-binding alpha-beta plait domain [Phytophthora cactorum]
MQPSSLTSLTDDKLARFVLGQQKKTKFQKEREDREAKKRQADEEAAKIYATFVASFDNEDETKGKAFVRGGTQAAQGNSQSAAQRGDMSEMDKMLQEIKQKDAEQREQVQTMHRPKKRRAIDEFLEEMKERGPAPISMEGVCMAKGSFDNGDPETTNLYVGNLAPTVTEEVLQVYSVKIMWPRSEEERARRRNCGFVSFYERRDADDARINLDNKEQLLEELTLERESVKKTMGFALDNSEAAVDLANIILESFKNSTSSGVTLIGLLYVTSDVLHNSSAAVKNASLFRTTFQECLPEIMDTLRIAHKNIAGRMSANAMKEKVMNVLTAWESWSLFPPAVLVGLHATFLRKVEENEYIATRRLNFEGIGESDLERLRKTCRQSGIMATGDAKRLAARLQWLKEFTSPTALTAPSVQPSTNSNVKETAVRKNDTNDAAAEAINEVGKENGSVDNLDGEPIDEDLDGDPIDREPIVKESDDIDGEPMDDEALDGEPLDGGTAEDDLDGEPLDGEDLDGAPMDEEDLDGELI